MLVADRARQPLRVDPRRLLRRPAPPRSALRHRQHHLRHLRQPHWLRPEDVHLRSGPCRRRRRRRLVRSACDSRCSPTTTRPRRGAGHTPSSESAGRVATIVSLIVVAQMVDNFGRRDLVQAVRHPDRHHGDARADRASRAGRGATSSARRWAPRTTSPRSRTSRSLSAKRGGHTFAVRTIRRTFVGQIIDSIPAFIGIILISFYVEEYGLGIVERSYLLLPGVVTGDHRWRLRRRARRPVHEPQPGRVITVFGDLLVRQHADSRSA